MFKNISRSNYSQTSLAQITYDDNKISFVIKKRKNKKTKDKWRKGGADEKETRRKRTKYRRWGNAECEASEYRIEKKRKGLVGVRVEAEGKKKEMIAKGGEGQRRGEGGGKDAKGVNRGEGEGAWETNSADPTTSTAWFKTRLSGG